MASSPEWPVAVQVTAPYSFWGPAEELKKGLPLEESETVELAGHVRCQSGRLFGRPCFMRLTNRRLAFVVHYALQSDRLIAVPFGALLEVVLVGSWIRLVYRSQSGENAITIRPPGLRATPEFDEDDPDEVGLDARGLADVLAKWLNRRRAEA